MHALSINPRTLVLVIAALLTAGLTAFLVQGWLDRQRAMFAESNNTNSSFITTSVLVAKGDMPAGTFVKPSHLRWQNWPNEGLDSNFITRNKSRPGDFDGAVVRSGLIAGEPITTRRIITPGDRGFLAAVLIPGKRAVSVPVNASSGIAGLVFPGDRVDLILAYKFSSGGGPTRKTRRASETVLADIRVLAIDQSTDDQRGKPSVGKTATLEVTPKQAEAVTLARELGKLTLSLRSLADDENDGEGRSPGSRVTRDSDVSRLMGSGQRNTNGVRILRGSVSGALNAVKSGLSAATVN